jgi:tRNA 2-selenouridine synthase
VDAPFDARVSYLVNTYGAFPRDLLQEAFLRLERRLGGQHCIAAIKALEDGDLGTAAGIALRYYDKSYAHANSKCAFQPVIPLQIAAPANPDAAAALIQTADEYRL